MLQIRGKRCRPKRRLMAWSTGAETAAEPHRTEKGAEPHKAEAAETHRGEMKEKPHTTELRTEPRRAGRGKSRKSGSP